MKYPVFKEKFLLEKIIAEKQEIAHSICLENLFHIGQQKNFPFFCFWLL